MTDTTFTARRFRPRSGSIKAACEYSGIGRSSLYVEAARHAGLFRKWGGKTIVDFNILDRVIDELPDAAIKAPPPPFTASRAERGRSPPKRGSAKRNRRKPVTETPAETTA
jgi:hypothetical protein